MSSSNLPRSLQTYRRSLDPDQMNAAILAIARIHRTDDAFALLPEFQRACASMGVASALYLHAIPSSGRKAHIMALLACDPRVAYGLGDSEQLLSDPSIAYARDHFEVRVFNRSAEGDRRETPLASLLGAHGFRSLLIAPTQSGGDACRIGALILGSEDEEAFEGPESHLVRILAHSLAVELHEWWMRHMRERLQEEARLRPGDLRILAMERDGLGSKQIARALGTSVASVNSRFQRINLKLNSPNRKTSAGLAVCHGLI